MTDGEEDRKEKGEEDRRHRETERESYELFIHLSSNTTTTTTRSLHCFLSSICFPSFFFGSQRNVTHPQCGGRACACVCVCMCVCLCVCADVYGGINDQCVTGIHLLGSCGFPNRDEILEMIRLHTHIYTHLGALLRPEEIQLGVL